MRTAATLRLNQVCVTGNMCRRTSEEVFALIPSLKISMLFYANKSFQFHQVFNLDDDNRAEDTPMLIDRKDNVFIISNFKSKYPVLRLDLRLISNLVVAIVSATCGGVAFALAGQPVITGYLLAGSIVGPGGFNFISEMVHVETVAQFGVIFLLFVLGLEFSMTKLRVVRAVAVLGGLLQVFFYLCAYVELQPCYVVVKFQKESLLVLFFLCVQLQWS
ncbi:hypothetical protein K1719_005583 [Acacia pycnantha]|nr:hypothetical protein K1719_005583 [Acacia pycnantha]